MNPGALQATFRAWFSLVLLGIPIAFLSWSIPAAAGDPSAIAALEPASIHLDESAQLTITVTGARAEQPDPPQVDGLRFYYRGQSSRMEWINGRSSSSISFLFMVEAEKTGTYTIPALTVKIKGKDLKTEPVRLQVMPPGSAASPQAPSYQGGTPGASPRLRSGEADEIGFMRIIPAKKKGYGGERIPFTIKAYFRQGIRARVESRPQVDGDSFVLENLGDKPAQTEENINGVPYTVLTWQGSISGIKSGKFPIEVEIDTTLLIRRSGRRPGSMFGAPFFDDPFFDNFFGTLSEKKIKLVSPKLTMEIKDLPTEGRPSTFKGAIGTFSLAISADPTNGKAGDPITLKMRISGTGNFDRVTAPVFTGGERWKSYPPSEEFSDKGGGKGVKEFNQAIVPKSGSLREIPPVTFSYFDPEAGEYITLESEAVPLRLQESEPSPAQIPAARNKAGKKEETQRDGKITPPVAGLAPPHTELGKLFPAIIPIYKKSWFQFLLGTAIVLLLTALFLIFRNRRLRADPTISIKKEINEKLRCHFMEMEKNIAAGDATTFLQNCRLAIQDRIGSTRRREPRSITLADLKRWLPADSSLLRVFQLTEEAEYMGSLPKANELGKMQALVKKELEELPWR